MQVNDAINVWGSVAAPILKQTSADFIGRFSDQEDPWYYASAGPFDFAPGESVNYVLAAVGGINEDAFYATADLAIATYNARFQAPGPPQRPDDFRANGVAAGPHGKTYDPVLHEYPIYYTPSGNITLTWDLTAAMSTPDPNSGEVDFGGIRLWRSVDRGLTWGQQWLDNQGTPLGWYPYRQWDLIDGFVGTDAMTGEYIGSDTGLVSSFTETDMVDGMEYWYAITAYDRGAWVGGLGGTEVFQPLSTARGDDPNYPTMVAVIAGSRPGGFVDGMIGTGTAASSSYYVLNSTGEAGNASIYVEVVDGTAITGDSYQLAVTDYFIDAFGDTTHSNVLTPATGDEFIAAGVTLTNTVTGSLLYQYREASREAYGWQNIPVTEGFRVYAQDVNDGQPGVYDWDAVGSHGWSMYRDLTPYSSGSLERVIHNDAYWDLDVIWRFFDASGDTNKAINRHTRRVVQVPFEIWDTDNNIRRWPVITDSYGSSDNWDHGYETIYVTTVPYANDFFDLGTYPDHDPANSTYWNYDEDNPAVSRSEWAYYFELDESDPDTWLDGETWHADMYRPLSLELGASLSFSTTTSTTDETLISMDEIRAVPNPYYVFAEWDQSDIRRKIQFTNVPTNSTIDIYTISGELIASLRHDPVVYNSDYVGTVDWNLWTFEFTEAAYGLYIYVVKTDDGRKKIGKLTIIR
jgi:hypothetical protein